MTGKVELPGPEDPTVCVKLEWPGQHRCVDCNEFIVIKLVHASGEKTYPHSVLTFS